MNRILFSSAKEEWSTPIALFDRLNGIFHFTLDAAANSENTKCFRYYTKTENGLCNPWAPGPVWCNPPYGRAISEWVQKAANEVQNGVCTVMLLPARTDTKWMHKYILNNPDAEVEFLRGRLRFSGSKNSAPFPSMLVYFGKRFMNGRLCTAAF